VFVGSDQVASRADNKTICHMKNKSVMQICRHDPSKIYNTFCPEFHRITIPCFVPINFFTFSTTIILPQIPVLCPMNQQFNRAILLRSGLLAIFLFSALLFQRNRNYLTIIDLRENI
jgi:hypothetical protein